MPTTSQPVYGYLKGPDGHFIVDPEAAPVVKQIFSLCLAGNGPTKIARMLTEQNIPTPGTMEYQRTGSTRRYYPDYPCKWSSNGKMWGPLPFPVPLPGRLFWGTIRREERPAFRFWKASGAWPHQIRRYSMTPGVPSAGKPPLPSRRKS